MLHAFFLCIRRTRLFSHGMSGDETGAKWAAQDGKNPHLVGLPVRKTIIHHGHKAAVIVPGYSVAYEWI